MPYKNKEDQRKAWRKHYQKKKDKYLQRNKDRKKEKRDFIISYKSITPCKDCGIIYPYYVMDFDHLDSKNKKLEVSLLVSTGTMKQVIEEMQKCELVCSNCHRIRTFNRR